jgi:hypothetical protein
MAELAIARPQGVAEGVGKEPPDRVVLVEPTGGDELRVVQVATLVRALVDPHPVDFHRLREGGCRVRSAWKGSTDRHVK